MQLLNQGLEQHEIALSLGIEESLVGNDIHHIREAWRRQRPETYQLYLNQELAKLAFIERQAFLGWKRSLETKTVEAEVGADGTPQNRVKRTRRRESTAGDPSFLNIALSCHRERAKLLGLTSGAPPDVDDGRGPQVIVVPQEMTWEDWAQRYGQEEQPDMQTIEAEVQALIDSVPPVEIPQWPS